MYIICRYYVQLLNMTNTGLAKMIATPGTFMIIYTFRPCHAGCSTRRMTQTQLFGLSPLLWIHTNFQAEMKYVSCNNHDNQ